ncbi:MAG: hypothetical protein Q9174_004526 [Haloplaca sp. 1 TL-2023]
MAEKGGYVFYHYTPSIAAAIIFVIIFTILTIAHTYRMIKHKLLFCLAFTIGGLFETIGYIGRALGHSDPQGRNAYIVQSLMILVAPALFAATIYMTLGRLMRATHSEHLSPVRVTWLTKLFVAGDIFSFFIQGGGGGIQASGKDGSKVQLGENIILGGLFLQIIIFGLFVVVSIIFHLRMKKTLSSKNVGIVGWEKRLWVLYLVSGLIMVRNVVRVIEYILGRDGYLLAEEWPIYIFDALLMTITMTVWLVWYPVDVKPGAALSGDVENGGRGTRLVGIGRKGWPVGTNGAGKYSGAA